MKISVYETSKKQDSLLLGQLGDISFKSDTLEKIVNILFTYRHEPMNDVSRIITSSGHGYIVDHLDTITLWLKNHTDIELKKSILHLNLKAEYFNDIKIGNKPFEYREKNDHWSKKIINRHYDEVHFKNGFPKKEDVEKIIKMPYRGYEEQIITHRHFNNEPTEVFAIHSKVTKRRDYRPILDGSLTIDFNSPKAIEFNNLCRDTNRHPSDVITEIYGSFDEMRDSGDIKIDFSSVYGS